MLNHPYITNAIVDERQRELRADAVTTRASGPRRQRSPRPRRLRAAAGALLGARPAQPQPRLAPTESCQDC
jgi:hypothetical protein